MRNAIAIHADSGDPRSCILLRLTAFVAMALVALALCMGAPVDMQAAYAVDDGTLAAQGLSTQADAKALKALIATAQSQLDNTHEADEGSAIEEYEFWATKADRAAFQAKIDAANTVATNDTATDAQVQEAYDTLDAELTAFTTTVRKAGTKPWLVVSLRKGFGGVDVVTKAFTRAQFEALVSADAKDNPVHAIYGKGTAFSVASSNNYVTLADLMQAAGVTWRNGVALSYEAPDNEEKAMAATYEMLYDGEFYPAHSADGFNDEGHYKVEPVLSITDASSEIVTTAAVCGADNLTTAAGVNGKKNEPRILWGVTLDDYQKKNEDLLKGKRLIYNIRLLVVIDKTALYDAITAAEQESEGVRSSDDGKNIASDRMWVTKATSKDFNAKLSAAKEAYAKAAATEAEIEQARADLVAVTATFKAEKKPGLRGTPATPDDPGGDPVVPDDPDNPDNPGGDDSDDPAGDDPATAVDKTTLRTSLSDARVIEKDVKTSANGYNVTPSETWTTSEVRAALDEAIAAGDEVAANAKATQAQVNRAVASVDAATATFKAAKRAGLQQPFSDIRYDGSDWVQADGWLQKALERNLMGGYTNGDGSPKWEFGPNDNVLRGQVAVILYRHAKPDSRATNDAALYETNKTGFVDNESRQYYTAAINWAEEQGILTGDASTNYTTVRPDAPVTRQELACMIHRYAKIRNADLSGATAASFAAAPDASQVAGWATEAMGWCYSHGVLTGDSATKRLMPNEKASRAQMAKMSVVATDIVSEAK